MHTHKYSLSPARPFCMLRIISSHSEACSMHSTNLRFWNWYVGWTDVLRTSLLRYVVCIYIHVYIHAYPAHFVKPHNHWTARPIIISTASLPVCLSICLSIYLSVCLSVCLPVYLSVCLLVKPHDHWTARPIIIKADYYWPFSTFTLLKLVCWACQPSLLIVHPVICICMYSCTHTCIQPIYAFEIGRLGGQTSWEPLCWDMCMYVCIHV